jgi:hypothetical protein
MRSYLLRQANGPDVWPLSHVKIRSLRRPKETQMFKRILLAVAFVAALAAGGVGLSSTAQAGHGCDYGYGGYRTYYYPGSYGYYAPRASYYRSYYDYPSDYYYGHRRHHGHRHHHHDDHVGISFSFGF